MNEFCRWCELKDTLNCALPPRRTRVALRAKIFGAQVLVGLDRVSATEAGVDPSSELANEALDLRIREELAYFPSRDCAAEMMSVGEGN